MTNFKNLLESKAFIVAILTTAAAVAANWGYNVPIDTIIKFITPLMIAIGALGWNDVTQTKMRMQHDHEVQMHALMHGNQYLAGERRDGLGRIVAVDSNTAQAGFARLGLLALVAIFGLVLMSGSACKEAQPVATDVVNCVKAEATVVSDGYSVAQLVAEVYGAIKKDGFLGALVELATKWGPDVVACVIDTYPAQAPTPGSTNVSVDYERKTQALQKLAPGKKLDHGKVK